MKQRVFNKNKYKLETSIVSLNNIKNNNECFRIDSEYVQQEFLNVCKVLSSFKSISENGIVVKGGKRLPLGSDFAEQGTPYIRAEDIKDPFIDYESSPKIDNNTLEKLKRYEICSGDVAITIVGNGIGDISLSKNDEIKCILTENCARLIETDSFKSNYIYAFMSSKYGKTQIIREKVGTAQPKLSIERIRNFKIADCSEKLQDLIGKNVEKSYLKSKESSNCFKEAQTIVNHYLKLDNFIPSNKNYSVRKKDFCFEVTNRLDAEYYMEKYDQYESLYSSDKTIAKICKVNDDKFKADDLSEYNYIELSDVNNYGRIAKANILFGYDLPSRAQRQIKKGDILISSLEGSSQSCALVTDKNENSISSNGFFVINSNEINSESLLMIFKSDLMQNIMKRRCSGSIMASVSSDDFVNIRIPYIDINTQKTIKKLVDKSLLLMDESEELLNKAIKAVEILVELGEKKAIDFIK